ncbi:VOC family protein [Paralimibaculum aggregatum]|uniref:VOC family protein n=1 Tax=Paralimibaculum aggregatum TaxID=3036245 RepID=A0ABQ6LQF4_9RHOB|nr:VOC family protein [Limibaculum sp. NKW23]GMG83303.1 VOC family protein [Limibaculum sp. NKW23]
MAARPPDILPYLTVRDARAALAFYAAAFGGETVMLLAGGDAVRHARLRIGAGMVMLYEERSGAPAGNGAPATLGGSPVAIRIELEDAAAVDAGFARAIAAGAEAVIEPQNRDWGRLAEIRDPEGHFWRLAATAEAEPGASEPGASGTAGTA